MTKRTPPGKPDHDPEWASHVDMLGGFMASHAHDDVPPVPEEQIREAERRFEGIRKDPSRAAPWRDAMERIRARFK
jgi:hypothetical protein